MKPKDRVSFELDGKKVEGTVYSVFRKDDDEQAIVYPDGRLPRITLPVSALSQLGAEAEPAPVEPEKPKPVAPKPPVEKKPKAESKPKPTAPKPKKVKKSTRK